MASLTQRFSRQLAVPLALTILVFTSGFSPFESLFAPSSNLIPRWADFSAESTQTVNQDEWKQLYPKIPRRKLRWHCAHCLSQG